MHRTSAQEMKVQMPDGLPAFLARIDDDAEALFRKAKLLRELRHDIDMDMRDERPVFLRQAEQTLDMLLRNDEYMHGRLRLEILEGDDGIVLINRRRGNLLRRDAAKNAVCHLFHLPSKIIVTLRPYHHPSTFMAKNLPPGKKSSSRVRKIPYVLKKMRCSLSFMTVTKIPKCDSERVDDLAGQFAEQKSEERK